MKTNGINRTKPIHSANRVDAASLKNMYDDCKSKMYYHVVLTLQDGSQIDGIIESVDTTSVNVLVGEDAVYMDEEIEASAQRNYNNPRRYRRFRRRNFPLGRLLAISLLPYPYYTPPYPYYPRPY